MHKTAILIGATGLVGSRLLQKLLLDDTFLKVKVFGRRATGVVHEKLNEINIDFANIDQVKRQIAGDVLFSCLGTTLKQAGSKEAQYKVDFTYQYQFAKYASENGVTDYFLVSTTSASAGSMFFYSRIKGELEDAVGALTFGRIVILQPSVLSGERKEKRLGESIGAKLVNAVGRVLPFLRKYRSISGNEVASAMISFYKSPQQNRNQILKLDEIHQAAR